MKRTSGVWSNFSVESETNRIAICNICNQKYSFKTTISNLKKHIINKHATYASSRQQKYSIPENGITANNLRGSTKQNVQLELVPAPSDAVAPVGIGSNSDDEDSNSSVKFSSEVWGYFEVEGDTATCTICQKSTENCVEEMRNHLEEEHPAVMIGILKKPDDEATDDETPQIDGLADDTFTEVVYLEEEPKPKRYKQRPQKRTRITQHSITQEKPIETPRIEYKVIPRAPEAHKPEIETFLNYVGCLLKNVPKETFPKLQLEIISLIVNAQMSSKPANVITTSSVGSHVEIPSSIAIATVNSTGDYRFTIANKESDSQ